VVVEVDAEVSHVLRSLGGEGLAEQDIYIVG
jgi:hypothetical protein